MVEDGSSIETPGAEQSEKEGSFTETQDCPSYNMTDNRKSECMRTNCGYNERITENGVCQKC